MIRRRPPAAAARLLRAAAPLILWLLLAPSLPARIQEHETERETYRVPEGFDPPVSLLSALAAVLREDDRCFVLAHPVLHEGRRDREALERRLASLREEFARLLPGRDLSDEQLLKMDLVRTGSLAFLRAREQDPDLEPQDLLRLVDPRFLRAPPVVPSRVWNEARKE